MTAKMLSTDKASRPTWQPMAVKKVLNLHRYHAKRPHSFYWTEYNVNLPDAAEESSQFPAKSESYTSESINWVINCKLRTLPSETNSDRFNDSKQLYQDRLLPKVLSFIHSYEMQVRITSFYRTEPSYVGYYLLDLHVFNVGVTKSNMKVIFRIVKLLTHTITVLTKK